MNWAAICSVAAKQMGRTMSYRVDWSDAAFPRIVRCDSSHDEAQSFRNAKREIRNHSRELIAHWREVNKRAAAMKPEDVEE